MKKRGGSVIEAITVKNLYKLYRVGNSTVRALDGVNFEIHKGEFCAIIGTINSAQYAGGA